MRNYSRIGIAFLESKECNSNPAQLPMTCWRGVSHATPGKSQANPSRHSNAARIALELELAELELLKFIVTPSHSKLSTVPTPRHSNAARIARRSDWRNWASPRCHATPRHRARPSESLQPGLPPAVDARTSEKTELEIKVKLRNPKSNSKITHHCNSGLPPTVDVSNDLRPGVPAVVSAPFGHDAACLAGSRPPHGARALRLARAKLRQVDVTQHAPPPRSFGSRDAWRKFLQFALC